MKRRKFLECSIKGMAGFTIAPSILNLIACSEDVAAKPNIILIVSDDTGWNDVGYHGSEIKTPNIDKLAKEGIELDNFYVSPVCSPTRAALLTGRHPSRFGILGPISGGSNSTLPQNTLTLPSFLKSKGYHTAITGKWHLGLKSEDGPLQHGFDYSYGYFHGQIDPITHLYKQGDKSWHRNDILIDEEGHATDLITNEAKKYLTDIRDKQKPFFLYVPYSAPHFPLQEDKKWLDMYPEIKVESRRQFAASMTHMDDGIGQIMELLEKNNIIKNTLVIYLSDNGAQKLWKSGPNYYNNKFPPAEVLGDNSPLRGWKAELYEGAIRVPALFYWKNKFKSAKLDEVTVVEDVYPTLARIIGEQIPSFANIEGESMLHAFEGAKMPDRVLYWRTDKVCSVRKGEWKLIHNGGSLDEGVNELYNINDDPYEKKNLFNEENEIAKDLILELEKQIKLDSIH